ncbi:MAG: chemotaxis protein CheB, partial [Nitrospiraceae bacterium]
MIVAIGASAGGLEAIEQFLEHMPADRRITFLIVVHRSTDQPTLLSQVLRSHTPMPVVDAVNGMPIKPSHVYVGPPGHYLVIRKNKLYLLTLKKQAGSTLPIDYCFRSVAEDRKRHAVGILLSGMGSDGTIGLRRIKDQGGLTLVQEPRSALHVGMPESAIGSDVADYVLPPNRMPDQLLRHVANPHLMVRVSPLGPAAPPSREAWDKIMVLIRDQAGHDFSCYKPSAILRRIERRMNVHHIKDLALYGRYLEETPNELTTLANELLIGVTSFFRDAEAWKAFAKAL